MDAGARPTAALVLLGATLGLAGVGCSAAGPDESGVRTSPPDVRTTAAGGVRPLDHLGGATTTADRTSLLDPLPVMAFRPAGAGPADTVRVHVDETRTFQRIDGVGASVTGSSASLLRGLDVRQRADLLRDLFSPTAGAGLSVLRQPLGPSDFSLTSQTYEVDRPASNSAGPNGPSAPVQRFTLDPDRDVLAVVKEIRGIRNVTTIASPWSAPARMKSTNSLVGGRLRTDSRDVYAAYLAHVITAYGAAGVPVAALTVQNEPSFSPPDYPGMLLDPAEQGRLAVALDRALAAVGQHPRLLVLDDNFDGAGDADRLLSDPALRTVVGGAAFHCYAGNVTAMGRVAARHPAAEVDITECSGGAFSGSFGDSLLYDAGTLLVDGFTNGASAVLKWNLALDPSGGPHRGGCRDCRGVVTIDPRTHAIVRNEEYYALGQVGRFVAPGARRIGTDVGPQREVTAVGFRNPDGSRAVLLVNTATRPVEALVTENARQAPVALPARSVTTVTY